MNMQLMLGVSVACYFISLFFLCVYKDKLNKKFATGLFIVVDIILFFVWNYATAEKGGLKDGFMTLENISPFIFTVIPLTVFMSKKAKEYAYSTIAFLHFGMFVATLVSPEYEAIFVYRTEANLSYAAEAMCHVLAALFGIYLMLTKQVKPDFAHWIKSVVFMLGWITFGVILNLTLDTRCFGMNPNNYSIYMIDIFGTFEATLIAYYFGVIIVLTVGMQTGFLLCKLVDKIKEQHLHHQAQKLVKAYYDDVNKKELAEKKKTPQDPAAEKNKVGTEQATNL